METDLLVLDETGEENEESSSDSSSSPVKSSIHKANTNHRRVMPMTSKTTFAGSPKTNINLKSLPSEKDNLSKRSPFKMARSKSH